MSFCGPVRESNETQIKAPTFYILWCKLQFNAQDQIFVQQLCMNLALSCYFKHNGIYKFLPLWYKLQMVNDLCDQYNYPQLTRVFTVYLFS